MAEQLSVVMATQKCIYHSGDRDASLQTTPFSPSVFQLLSEFSFWKRSLISVFIFSSSVNAFSSSSSSHLLLSYSSLLCWSGSYNRYHVQVFKATRTKRSLLRGIIKVKQHVYVLSILCEETRGPSISLFKQ